MGNARILIGDALDRLHELPDGSVQTCVTSPPYWGLRDYGNDGQLGLEPTPDEYVANMVAVFREVRRVLADDGTLWLNLGDSYKPSGNGSTKKGFNERYFGRPFENDKQGASEGHLDRSNFRADFLKPKDLVGIPWRVAFALQSDGWWLRQDIIWHKPNPMPESVTDRCTKAHEYLFLLSKSARYFYDAGAIKEPGVLGPHVRDRASNFKKAGRETFASHLTGAATIELDGTRNKRSVWTVATKPYSGAHFAVMPADLVEPCVLAGSKTGDTVLDPFTGSGTVGMVALRHGREFVGVELNPDYADLANKRIYEDGPLCGRSHDQQAQGHRHARRDGHRERPTRPRVPRFRT
jgi:DNA modification methylase